MFNFFLNTGTLSVGEKLSIGGQVTLLGMGTVFAVLIILWGLVEVLHILLGHPSEKKKSSPIKAEAPAVTVTPTRTATEADVTPIQTSAPPAGNDLAVIAVITAAIAAASGQSPTSFRVVTFKRANNKFSGK